MLPLSPARLFPLVPLVAACLASPPSAATGQPTPPQGAVRATMREATRATAQGAGRAAALAPPVHGARVPRPFAGSGELAAASCPEPPLIRGNVPRTREYLTVMLKCLDASWSRHFARAGLPYRKPVARFYEDPEPRVCGVRWPSSASAFYCTERGTLVFLLAGWWVEGRTDLYPLKVAAHEYGHHLQSLTGLRRHYEARARADRARQPELARRYELQADCLSGVFVGGVWRSLSRTGGDWAAVVEATRASGDDDGHRSHGKGTNRAYWLKRGFTTRSPAACDTWTAPAARVS
ncbi:neutral zinc metallopeptidase [Nonomuraea lactucae]|uniref:neutral zinc metallopeptidase n=1 Tax=Nonomuraea lactucae TaxID=2249762 RepID=UPI001F0675FD|nr:neutral zinc metallopeptidase [Nonomuraea lactucae]